MYSGLQKYIFAQAPQRSANNVKSCAKNLEMTSTGAGKKDKQRYMIRKNLHPAAERYYLLQQQ